jgi:hypothetical protein
MKNTTVEGVHVTGKHHVSSMIAPCMCMPLLTCLVGITNKRVVGLTDRKTDRRTESADDEQPNGQQGLDNRYANTGKGGGRGQTNL